MRDGNHVEMGLHVFFGNYYQLFELMEKVGALENLRLKQHTHTFINEGGRIGELDFRFFIGAPFNGLKAFFTTSQLSVRDKVAKCDRAWYQYNRARFGRLRGVNENDPQLR
jgi:zeta-carotene desaturase